MSSKQMSALLSGIVICLLVLVVIKLSAPNFGYNFTVPYLDPVIDAIIAFFERLSGMFRLNSPF